jgi:hypothetical protein
LQIADLLADRRLLIYWQIADLLPLLHVDRFRCFVRAKAQGPKPKACRLNLKISQYGWCN